MTIVTQGSVYRLWVLAMAHGADFHISFVPPNYKFFTGLLDFDPQEQTSLFELGYQKALDLLAAQFGVPRQLGFFLSEDLTASLNRAKSGYRVGESTIAGVLCDHLALRNDDLDVQVWIEKGELSERIFTHSPPQDAERVDFLADMLPKESELE